MCLALVLPAGCSHGTTKQDPSFFTIRPVTRQTPPPCTSPALAEERDGQAVGCYELGPAQVDATDVKSAALVTEPRTGTDEVEFTLTPNGTERFNALARSVGLGGQAAIVVDGMVVNAPRFSTTDFPGKGVVTGLATDRANRLVQRFNHR